MRRRRSLWLWVALIGVVLMTGATGLQIGIGLGLFWAGTALGAP